MRPHFINVDFEFISLHDMSDLISELGSQIEILVNEKSGDEHHLNFEIPFKKSNEPSDMIMNFFEIINSLTVGGRADISKCSVRIIDLGYKSGSDGWLYNAIPNVVLNKISDEGFQLNISIYGDPFAEKEQNRFQME